MHGTHATDCRKGRVRAPLAWPYQRRRWESNPLKAALQAAALPSGSSATSYSVLARSRTWSSTFAGSRAIRNTPRTYFISAPRRGIEPGHRAQQGPAVSRTAMRIRHTRRACIQVSRPGLEPGPCTMVVDLRRVLCDPLHHRDVQHPDLESNQAGTAAKRWSALGKPYAIRYTIGTDKPEPTTGFAPASSGFGHRAAWSAAAFLNRATSATQAGVQGFEPCRAALETASSPRRTLLYRPPALRPGTVGVTTTPSASRSSTLR